jgi:hypothetical protein
MTRWLACRDKSRSREHLASELIQSDRPLVAHASTRAASTFASMNASVVRKSASGAGPQTRRLSPTSALAGRHKGTRIK